SGNEDEVFVGPLGHKEKCIAANIEANESAEKSIPASDELMWSPLKGEKFVEIFKEAHLLALRIETESKNEQTKICQPEEKFVEESKSKLNILKKENIEKSPRAVKRETYCVQDSLACQLPACFQKESDKLLSDDKTHALHTPPNRSPVKTCVSSTKIASSPLTQEQKMKERNTKATGKLPMAKPLSTLGKGNLLVTEKVKPGKQSSISTKRELNSMGSSEDLISDKSSAASDVFESSFSGSFLLQDKKASSKPSLKKTTHLKLPGVASGLTRKMTTSSLLSVSSMNSSLNSSLLISPIRKNGKSSMSSKGSVSGSKLSLSTNRLAKVSSLQAVNTEKSRSQPRSASTHKISTAESLANSLASATSEAVGSGIQRLSSVPDLQKLCQQNKDGSGMRGSLCPKPRARILSVPTCQTKVSMKTGGKHLLCMTYLISWLLKANKLLANAYSIFSAVAVSTPVKAAEDGIFQNFGFPKRSVSMTPASLKRSGLPTPVRRISGFPAVTPKPAPTVAFSPHVGSICPISNFSTKKTLAAGSKQTKQSETQVSSSEDDVSPPPVLPLALNFSPEKTATEVVENNLKENEVQNQLTEDKQTEVLLVDVEDKPLPHTLECESKPLIDLSNTPELSRIAPLKPIFSEQLKLIDLSSPLITLSPDVNKENLDSPLLKF
ncbi:GTSE1 protein, partial [Tricholaema leucomelas]|nr:GTSE1 protein [Tricholaema leucomelas]